jgi:predicted DNA-binding transcriptional regulator AlpA
MENKRIPSNATREVCGGISDMTLWRWLNDPALQFPKPIYIGRRRYWKEAEVLAWLESREQAPARKAA